MSLDPAEQMTKVGRLLTVCPPVEEVEKSTFCGVPLAEMSRDDLIQIIRFLGQRRTAPACPV